MRRFIAYGPALLVLLAAGVALFAAPAAVRHAQLAHLSATAAVAQAQLDESTLLEQLNAEVAAVHDAVMPSVVHLETIGLGPDNERQFATGSGWLLDDRGHIVTNAHVVRGGMTTIRDIDVELFDGRVKDGTLLGYDRRTDIAVVKIDPGSGVIPMRRATRQPLRVGDRVFAFGSPFGIKFSMSQGVISGLNRSEGSAFLGMGAGYSNYIQTDAAINPGNSGGPLVDVNGRLVGMNTAIANNRRQNRESEGELQGQSAGIAFAVPLDTIEAIAQQIIRHDFVLRGYLGVGIGRSTPERLARLGFSGRGVIVTNTPNNQPAERAGLEPGDIIVRIANAPTPNSDALRAVISVRAPGQVVPVTVWRDGEELEIPVTLGAAYDVPSGGGLAYIPNSERLGAEGSRQWYRDNVLSEDDEDDESAL